MAAVHEPEAYKYMLGKADFEDKVKQDLIDRDFTPQLVSADMGTSYPPTPTGPAKVYVVLEGLLMLWVNQDYFQCLPGSRTIIPPETLHWYRAGADGCRFLIGLHGNTHETAV